MRTKLWLHRFKVSAAVFVVSAFVGAAAHLFLDARAPRVDEFKTFVAITTKESSAKLKAKAQQIAAAAQAAKTKVADKLTQHASAPAAESVSVITAVPQQSPAEVRAQLETSIANGDLTGCTSITHLKARADCRNKILLKQATRARDTALCDEIDTVSKRQFCLDSVRLERVLSGGGYFDLCAKINTEYMRKECDQVHRQALIEAGRDGSECADLLLPDNRQRCNDFFYKQTIQNIGQSRGEAPNCQQFVSNEAHRRACLLAVAIQQASQSGNPTPCRELVNIADRSQCLVQMQAALDQAIANQIILQAAPYLCADLPSKTLRNYCSDYAFLEKARKEYKPLLCRSILNDSLKNDCVTEVGPKADLHNWDAAMREGETEFCMNIFDSERQKECLQSVVQRRAKELNQADLVTAAASEVDAATTDGS